MSQITDKRVSITRHARGILAASTGPNSAVYGETGRKIASLARIQSYMGKMVAHVIRIMSNGRCAVYGIRASGLYRRRHYPTNGHVSPIRGNKRLTVSSRCLLITTISKILSRSFGNFVVLWTWMNCTTSAKAGGKIWRNSMTRQPATILRGPRFR